MTRADSVHSTLPLNTSSLPPIAGLDWLDIEADASPADSFRAIGKLPKEAREEDLAESGIGDFDGLLEQVGTQDYQPGALA